MKFFKRYVEEETWEEITEEDVIKKTEGHGYYHKGTVVTALKEGAMIRTPWAFYKLKETK